MRALGRRRFFRRSLRGNPQLQTKAHGMTINTAEAIENTLLGAANAATANATAYPKAKAKKNDSVENAHAASKKDKRQADAAAAPAPAPAPAPAQKKPKVKKAPAVAPAVAPEETTAIAPKVVSAKTASARAGGFSLVDNTTGAVLASFDVSGKKRKNPDAPKRPPSEYNLFMKKRMCELKATNPALSHKDAFTNAAKSWKGQV